MRRYVKDIAATILVIGIVTPYVGYLVRGEVPFIENIPSMAGAGLILGLFAFIIGAQPNSYGTGRYLLVMTVFGLSTLGLGLAAYTTESAGVLGAFMAMVLVIWLTATTHHLRMEPRSPSRVDSEPLTSQSDPVSSTKDGGDHKDMPPSQMNIVEGT